MTLDDRVIRAHLDIIRVVKLAFCGSNVLRNIHHHRTRTTCIGNVKRFFDCHGDVAHILDQKIVLDAGAGNSDRIALLKGILTNVIRWHLPGDDHHGNGVHVSGGDTGHGIGRARTGGNQSHANLVCRARQAISRMHGRLFMADQNMLDLVLLEQFVVNMKNRAAGIAEYIVDLFFLQAPDYNLRTAYHGYHPRLTRQNARKSL